MREKGIQCQEPVIRKNEMATDTFLMSHSLSKPAGNHFSTVTIYAYYTYTHTHTKWVGDVYGVS